jgi:uncharacterized alkaline shock family protein YloU
MSVNTSNAYGKISVSDIAIAKVAERATMESYGIMNTTKHRFIGSLAELLKKDAGGRNIKITTAGNRIYIDVYVAVKYGVSINAVAESLKETIKYKVERFTGMIVDTVNVNVVGVKM